MCDAAAADLSRRASQRVHGSLFFFSSRRRHTRFDYDWSSDVCSSDLLEAGALPQAIEQYQTALALGPTFHDLRYKLGRMLLQGGQALEAREQFEIIVRNRPTRSEERRVGEESRSRGAPYH